MNITEILKEAVELNASEIFLIGGLNVTFKVSGRQVKKDGDILRPNDIKELVSQLYTEANRENKIEKGSFEDDFSFAKADLARFRINTFIQRGSYGAVIKVLMFGIPDPEAYHIPQEVLSIAEQTKGLCLITGSTGSGKSTSIACVIDRINSTKDKTIITMEDPIEYVHRHNRSIVIQREINTDTESYLNALRASLRESPDVLVVGEMRDPEAVSTAMTAAETGKLVISSLHTNSASDTIDRIVDAFPAQQQSQIRIQLSRVLNTIICQQLIPGKDGQLYPAFEIVQVTPAIRNLIREGKTYQLSTFIQEGRDLGMRSMNDSLEQLVKDGIIDKEDALKYSDDVNSLKRHLCM